MKILLLNQTFHPDVVATALYLSDLAQGLREKGHEVAVIAGSRAYDNLEKRFPARENWNGIEIYRIPSTGFGKGAKWRRAIDFASFMVMCGFKLLTIPRFDAVVSLTSPPLISVFGAAAAKIRGAKFYYWVMDLNPDEAIAAGWLRAKSFPARVLEALSRFSFRNSEKIFALDRFMRDRIRAKEIPEDRIEVIPPWSLDDEVSFDPEGRDLFREKHGLTDKYVIMYSGNHSPCHPLDSVVDAAVKLKEDTRFVFFFVGGGSEHKKIARRIEDGGLRNVRCLPYQPMEKLAGSLSAADLHVVVMGEPFVGMIHPCKIYNILSISAPFLFIGPEASHVGDLIAKYPDAFLCRRSAQGEVDTIADHIKVIADEGGRGVSEKYAKASSHTSKEKLMSRFIELIEKGHQRG